MWFELGTSVCLVVSCTTTGLMRDNFLALVAGRLIADVIPSVLCLVMCWCVCGAFWTTVGAVGFVVIVTGGAGTTL